ncbi:MAG: aminotransferase class V-fold PLP-dependent enzyme, partial [Candidatus Hydrogenedentes bacterium]|nr:aminotransferase class V-fold PLP-dependent enzyme [Candidatus Hydrogenedentota bacterium]
MNALEGLVKDEVARRTAFPVVQEGVFLAHAGVAPLPRVAVEAIHACVLAGSRAAQENPEVGATVSQARADAARLLGAAPEEISLVGPTSLGLSMVARGLAWQPGDEVVYYAEDYPANVYPWTALAHWGVKPAPLQPEYPGVITWDVVERALGERTRLVALASCHFLSGHRIDVAGIGQALHDRGVLFSLDAIQSLGAFPMDVRYVDFLSADSHKWLLGPCGAGIFYVKQSRKEQLAPMVLGAGNVACPEFVAQDTLSFDAGARRYEPGALNLAGICGMGASLRLLLDCGVE